MKDGGRGIPRAMVIGVLLVMLIYVLLNVAFLRVLGLGRMAGEPFVAASRRQGAVRRAGRPGHPLAGAGLDPERDQRHLPDVTARGVRDEPRPAAASRVRDGERRRHADRGALGEHRRRRWVSSSQAPSTRSSPCALSSSCCKYTLSLVSLFALRRSEPDTPRPFRVPGYPVTPALALAASLAFLVGSVVTDWSNSWKSLVLLAISYPIYRLVAIWRGGPA